MQASQAKHVMHRPGWIASALWCCLVAATLAQENLQPIANEEFYGRVSKHRVASRFEIYDPHSLAELEAVKAMGFDQVILDRAPLHAQATPLGLDVVIANWWTDETDPQLIQDSLELCRQVAKGRLKAISLMDEPERNSPDTPFSFYIDLYKELKPQMTGRLHGARLEISYWGPLASWDERYYEYFSYLYEAADAMRIMPYPDLHEGPLGDVYLMLQRSRRAMSLAQVDIPHIVILQTWVLPPENKLPTIPELRVMAYQALLGGAETVSFFEYKPELWKQTPGFEDEFKLLMAELVAVRDRLQSASLSSQLNADGIMLVDVTWPEGHSQRIRINTQRHAVGDLSALEIDDETKFLNLLRQPGGTPSTASSVAVAHCEYSPIPCQQASPAQSCPTQRAPRWLRRKCRPRRFR